MKIIPVIDYQESHVVLAKKGQRDQYKAVTTPLCSSSDLYHVVDSILTLASFKTIYIADLDCIEKQRLDPTLWSKLCATYQSIEFWIDLGAMSKYWPDMMLKANNARPVIGTESFQSNDDLNSSIQSLIQFNPLLSIDFKHGSILGPKNIELSICSQVNDIIVLSIDHVGSNTGPNLEAINQIQASTKSAKLYYGGGIRNIEDIDTLEDLGISGALSASLLHRNVINKKQLKEFTS